MICPHCNANLLYKERSGRTCSRCTRKFAFDPKTNELGLHDLRIRKLAGKLTDSGRLTVTVGQLEAAASRGKARSGSGLPEAIGCAVVGGPVGIGLVVGGVYAEDAGILSFFGAVLLFAVVVTVVSAVRRSRHRTHGIRISASRNYLLHEWMDVYGSLPDGVVDEKRVRDLHRPEHPNAVLLCPDPSVIAFLALNGIPERYGVSLVSKAYGVPNRVPVVVLHDASAKGCLLARRTREALPGRRVLDAGLPPSAVMKAPGALSLRGVRPSTDEMGRLRAESTLTGPELEWLAKGWISPLVAVPPAKLLATVSGVLERVLVADPDGRKAEAIGFLTWPGESGSG
ncbi:hypothetical protein ACFYYD_29300 [Streptomyces bluensis]|uniref:hypothetical protein n=1 Tax=Streptomyces bluensis TaxID=33897 RepID=UPI0036BB9D61